MLKTLRLLFFDNFDVLAIGIFAEIPQFHPVYSLALFDCDPPLGN